MTVTVLHGDCLDVMASMPDASVDAVVTDPPYGLEFMSKDWDSFRKDDTTCATSPETAPTRGATTALIAESARSGTASCAPSAGANGGSDPARAASATIVRPDSVGGFQDGNGGNAYSRSRVRTNTQRHGGDATIANQRFQRWCEQWTTECLRVLKPGGYLLAFGGSRTWHRLACAVEDAGFEVRDSIAWLYGSGFPKSLDVSKAIDKAAGAARENGARRFAGFGTALKPAFEPIVVARKPLVGTVAGNVLAHGTGALNIDGCRVEANGERFGGGARGSSGFVDGYESGAGFVTSTTGRWPTNVVLDGHAADELDRQSGTLTSGKVKPEGASRFFPTFHYQAKAPTRERPKVDGVAHPTVKPLGLMRWLVRLVTPPGGLVLDPFAGSGTTGEAAILEGFDCVLIERDAEYLPLIDVRLARARGRVAPWPATAEIPGGAV